MSTEIEFVDGLFFKEPRAQAPDYVKGSISIQPAKLAAWLQKYQGQEWVNIDVKESKGGKVYCAVNDWKPGDQRDAKPKRAAEPRGFVDDEIPFAPHGKRAHWIA